MEEYRAIAKRILVPSFFSMLAAGSAVFLTYSYLFDSKIKTSFGIVFLLITLVAFFFYLRHKSCTTAQNNYKSENNTVRNSWKSLVINKSRSAYFYHIPITLLLSILIVYRIIILTQHVQLSGKATNYIGLVESVKSLRYSNEIAIGFSEAENINTGYIPLSNKAISYTDKEIKINPSDEIIISAKPVEIKSDKKNISSFEKDLLRKGFHYIFYLNNKNFKIIKNAPIVLKDRIRNAIEGNLSSLFNEKTIPMLKGLYFANGSYIDKTTTTDFKRAGVLHILAASGEHIGIIAAAFLILLNPLLINRKIIRLIISVILLFYLYITDMPVSLLRAFVMYNVYSIQYFFDFDKNILNTLFLSAIIILIIHPYELYGLGFQLSFGATFGIIIFYNFYKEVLSFLPVKISQLMSVTFSAQAVVFPVIFIQLREINLTGLLSNVILVFTMSVTLISSLAVNAISILSVQIAKYIAIITDFSYLISLKIVQYLSGSNGHFVYDKWYLLLIPYLLFLFPIIPVIKNRKVVIISFLFSIVLSWSILSAGYTSANKKIIINNNDKNSIVLLKNSNNNIIFGELTNIADAELIAGYCNGNNIRNIILCISCPDLNNLKSYSYFIKKTIVSECIISPDFMFSGHFKKFCKTLDTDGIKLRISKFGNYSENDYSRTNNHGFIKKLFESPLENISKIHFLLSQAYEQKISVLREIADSGYEIEYLK